MTAGLMCAPRKVARRVDHHHDQQAKDDPKADRSKYAVLAGVNHDRTAAREDERESG